jgi:ADP-dependent NAD(P)H-hydrate dehydratase / NAD(P)H-hydrate epimerase
MKVFLTDKVRLLDAETIRLEGIKSSDLMERASDAVFRKIRLSLAKTENILVFSGPGNNGGDALAISRLLIISGYPVTTVLCKFGKELSKDADIQLGKLKGTNGSKIICLENVDSLNLNEHFDVIIEGLFGSGLNRPLEGYFAKMVQWINSQSIPIISIDVPGGLFCEDNSKNIPQNIVKANHVIGLQFPKLAYFLPENEPYLGKWDIVDIGINSMSADETETSFFYTQISDIKNILHKRPKFAHKGDFGKSLLIAGSKGMAGAAILAAKGALRSGIGLLTLRIPEEIYSIVQTAVPEAMAQTYENGVFWNDTCCTEFWTAIAIGPGLGKGEEKAGSLKRILEKKPQKLVLDADALNLVAENQSLLSLLPENCILTPHPGEFERLAGQKFHNGYERLEEARRFASKYHVNIVLKGAYTACINPEGICHFNSTGNPGMATGGCGDVLTGIIVSLLSQGYSPEESCKLGTFLHGFCGDLSLQKQSEESLIASDLPNYLGKVFNILRSY